MEGSQGDLDWNLGSLPLFCLSDYPDLLTECRPLSKWTMTQGWAVDRKAERVCMRPAVSNLPFKDMAGWYPVYSIWKRAKGTGYRIEEFVPESKRRRRRRKRK